MQVLRHLSVLTVALLASPAIAQNYGLPIQEHVFENGLRLLVIGTIGTPIIFFILFLWISCRN